MKRKIEHNISIAVIRELGHPVITKQNLVAKNAADNQTINFPSNDIYQIQLQIKGLLKAGQTADLTRNGIARGYVVVPEFPAVGVMLLIGSIFIAIIAFQKFEYISRTR